MPSLWFYGDNDSYFVPETWQRMHAEYVAAGGWARLVAFGSFGNDAHGLFPPPGTPIWLPEVGAFFAGLGLPFVPVKPQAQAAVAKLSLPARGIVRVERAAHRTYRAGRPRLARPSRRPQRPQRRADPRPRGRVRRPSPPTPGCAIVLGGSGKAFCAGADLAFMREVGGYTWEQNRADAETLAEMLWTLYTCPVPVVARIHGDCYAGGSASPRSATSGWSPRA